MIRHIGAALTAVALLWASQAGALTLTNRDAFEHSVQIFEDGDEEALIRDIVIAANQTLDGVCLQPCTLALVNGSKQNFLGGEIVYLENGGFVEADDFVIFE